MPHRIKIVLLHNSVLFKKGICAMLENYPEYLLIYEVESFSQLVIPDPIAIPDILLVQVNGNSDFKNQIRSFQKSYPNVGIIGILDPSMENEMPRLLMDGIKGFLHKKSDLVDVQKTIKNVYSKSPIIIPTTESVDFTKKVSKQKDSNDLSLRELEIIKLICKEYTNKEIADLLFISPRTVDSHREKILQKTGAKNTAGIVKYAINYGLYFIGKQPN